MINFNFDFFRWCNNGVQIVNKNYFDDVINELKIRIGSIHKHAFIEAVVQDIISYVHRKNNGVYLQPEWNWFPISKLCNNNVIIEHYYGVNSKKKLKEIYENSITD